GSTGGAVQDPGAGAIQLDHIAAGGSVAVVAGRAGLGSAGAAVIGIAGAIAVRILEHVGHASDRVAAIERAGVAIIGVHGGASRAIAVGIEHLAGGAGIEV